MKISKLKESAFHKSNQAVFHKSVGYASSAKEVPTPLKMIGRGVKKVGKKIIKKLDKTFIEPSRRHNKFLREQDAEYRRKAESGEYNR